jgi:cobalt-zinc-cadmium efflux system membrane fusion protein
MSRHVILTLACLLAAAVSARAQEKGHDHDHKDEHSHTEAQPTGKHDHADDKHGDEHGHVDEVKLSAEAIKAANIRVEPVKKHALTTTITAPARIAFNPDATAHVGCAVVGRAAEVKVRVGDSVKKGDELIVIESTELGQAQSEYLQKRTEVAVAAARVEPAKLDYERAKKLYEQNGGVSLAEVQKRQAELKSAEGNVLAATAAATAAMNRLTLLGMSKDEVQQLEQTGALNPRLVIRAPLAGRVIERSVTLGELVGPDKEHLLVLADTRTMLVLADVPESRLTQIAPDSPARVVLAAMPDAKLEGKVTQVEPSLNPDTRAGRVRIEVANLNDTLRGGMFASVELTTTTAVEPALAVPDDAVLTVEGSPAVFVPVEGEENTFAKRAVKVGPSVGLMTPILEGLKEGEPVVVGGAFILKAELGKGEAGHHHDH